MARLSDKQRELLAEIAVWETPTEEFPKGLPFYTRHTHMQFDFNTEAERDRWYKNLETRGLITITKGCSMRLTDAGRAAISAKKGDQS